MKLQHSSGDPIKPTPFGIPTIRTGAEAFVHCDPALAYAELAELRLGGTWRRRSPSCGELEEVSIRIFDQEVPLPPSSHRWPVARDPRLSQCIDSSIEIRYLKLDMESSLLISKQSEAACTKS